MTRPLRINYDGAMYHVMNRGACRMPIFRSDKLKKVFLDLLEEIVLKFRIEIHAYCLMGNHYHLLIRTPYANISKAMQHLSSVYTIKYNKLEERDGPLFRGRFKSILIEDDRYGVHLVRYIHRNPLEAGMVQKIEDYQWSSYCAYLGMVGKPDWLYFNYTLSQFSQENFFSEFRNFTYEGNPEPIEQCFYGNQQPPIIGSEDFIKRIKAEFSYCELSEEIAERKILRPSLDQIMSVVSEEFAITPDQLKKSTRGKTNNAMRMAMLISSKYFGYKLTEIACFYGILRYQAVSKSSLSLARVIENDSHLRSLLTEAVKRLQHNLKSIGMSI
jgi:putative transposase